MIDAAYLNNLTAQIDAVEDCAGLQVISTRAIGALNDQVASISAQIAALAPFLALATAPTNPTQVITWITNFITAFIGPQVAASVKYTADLAAMATAIANVTAALTAAEARITNCSITIP